MTILISVFVIAWFCVYLLFISLGFQEEAPLVLKLLMFFFGITVAGLIGGMVATLFIRLKEIDKESKDDLSKY